MSLQEIVGITAIMREAWNIAHIFSKGLLIQHHTHCQLFLCPISLVTSSR
jgi:hypothetical protein